MSELHRVGDLEVGQDLGFVKRLWTFQRVGWGVMALIILAALLGVFGKGPVSTAAAGEAGQVLSLEYHRFWRYRKPDDIVVHLGPRATAGGEARVWLKRDYLEKLQMEYITPQPSTVLSGDDRVIYVFKIARPGEPTAVTFNFMPEHIGSLDGEVGVEGGPSLRFDHFYYP